MQKQEVFLNHQIFKEDFLWGGNQYIVFWPKSQGSQYRELHRFETLDDCKEFIRTNDAEPETWIQRYLG